MSRYDTNLASEYYVLACLHRLGIAAALTLGNKKGVDILVAREAGDAVTVEVKGVRKALRLAGCQPSKQSPRPALRRAREFRRQDRGSSDAAAKGVGGSVPRHRATTSGTYPGGRTQRLTVGHHQ